MAQVQPSPILSTAAATPAALTASPAAPAATAAQAALAQKPASAEVLQKKPVDLTPEVSQAVLALKEKTKDLSTAAQDKFRDSFLGQVRDIAGLCGVFTELNHLFAKEKADTTTHEKWRVLREKEVKGFEQLQAAYQAYKEVFTSRIQALTSAIHDSKIEKALLKAVTIGCNSYWASTGKSAERYYGADYKLWEIDRELSARKYKLSIKADEKAPDTKLPEAPKAGTLMANVEALQESLANLKEEAAVIDAALRIEANADAKESEWPKKFYQQLTAKLAECKVSIDQRRKEVEDHFKTIEEEIASKPENEADLKRAKNELNERWTATLAFETETAKILANFKSAFNLEDPKEKSDVKAISDAYVSCASRLYTIVCQREQVMLSKSWEALSEPLKKATYFRDTEEYAKQAAAKERLYSGTVVPREKQIDTAIGTYEKFIELLKSHVKHIEAHGAKLEAQAQMMSKWGVAPVMAATAPATPPTKAKEAPVVPAAATV